jgi:hypothetical protein
MHLASAGQYVIAPLLGVVFLAKLQLRVMCLVVQAENVRTNFVHHIANNTRRTQAKAVIAQYVSVV